MEHRSQCPVASGLDIFGDKWTLVVLRTIFAGRRRYSDLLAMPERISTNILADRLALLERQGLIAARPYQVNPLRHEYHLTAKGADILPILQAIARWSVKHIPGRWPLPDWFVTAEPQRYYPV
ncbi:MAG: helix-turn-helix transcriptional regulator [Rhizobiales bacterium]|nr:helix-turn-helix transcriptional regulator [Hyphomicrobiales bacterium]